MIAAAKQIVNIFSEFKHAPHEWALPIEGLIH